MYKVASLGFNINTLYRLEEILLTINSPIGSVGSFFFKQVQKAKVEKDNSHVYISVKGRKGVAIDNVLSIQRILGF